MEKLKTFIIYFISCEIFYLLFTLMLNKFSINSTQIYNSIFFSLGLATGNLLYDVIKERRKK